jgi:hypothetical protein
MTWDEYNKLFHKLQLNRVAFKRLTDCDREVLELVNAVIATEREECAKVCDKVAEQMLDEGEGPTGYVAWVTDCAKAIRERSKT